MKKSFLSIILAVLAISAFAINYQVWWLGTWSTTVQYGTKPIPNSSNRIGQMVFESQNSKVYITSGTSTPIVGTKPESQSAAWVNISG